MEFQTLCYSTEVTPCSHTTEDCAVRDGSLSVGPSPPKLQICRVEPIVHLQTFFVISALTVM